MVLEQHHLISQSGAFPQRSALALGWQIYAKTPISVSLLVKVVIFKL